MISKTIGSLGYTIFRHTHLCLIFRSIGMFDTSPDRRQDFKAGSRAAIGGGVLDNYQYRIQVGTVGGRVGKRSGPWVIRTGFWICLMKISPGFCDIFCMSTSRIMKVFGVSLTSEGFWGVEFSCLLMCTALTMLWGIGNWIGWSSTVVTLPIIFISSPWKFSVCAVKVSPWDCTGCELCVRICPADALKLADAAKVIEVHGAVLRPCEDFDVPGVRYSQIGSAVMILMCHGQKIWIITPPYNLGDGHQSILRGL